MRPTWVRHCLSHMLHDFVHFIAFLESLLCIEFFSVKQKLCKLVLSFSVGSHGEGYITFRCRLVKLMQFIWEVLAAQILNFSHIVKKN